MKISNVLAFAVVALALVASAYAEPESFAEVSAQVNAEAALSTVAVHANLAEMVATDLEATALELEDMVEEEPSLIEEASEKPSPKKIAKKAKKQTKKAAKKAAKAKAVSSIAKNLKKAGKKARKALLKSKSKIKAMAKQLGLSAKAVKNAIKNPKKAAKKAKKQAKNAKKKIKKAVKKAKKQAKKLKKAQKKFQPKKKSILLKKTSLTKKLRKVVEGEPESAAIAKAQNNWAWEDAVVGRLDKYVPPDPKNIKNRIEKFEKEADAVCGKAASLCVQQKLAHPVNPKTCVKAKKACYHAKVAVKIITKAATVCVETQKTCGRKDWKGKGDCLVAKAQCKRLMLAVDYQYEKTHKVGRIVRDMEFHDNEANGARDDLAKKSKTLTAAQKAQDGIQPEAEKCKAIMKKAKQCEMDMDKSEECEKAQDKAEKCEETMTKFDKAKDKTKEAKKVVNKAIQDRNVAEKEAQQGF